jgi:hypothetical protein
MSAMAAANCLPDRAGVHPRREIGAGAERAARGGEHDRADRRIGVEPLERSPSSPISAASKKLCGGRRISTVATMPSMLTPISRNPA